MILTVTGHRPPKLGGYKIPNPVYDAVIEALDRCLMQLRPETVITGMALGVDQWVAELCANNDIPFIAAIPFKDFDQKWPNESQLNYQLLLNRAKEVRIISEGGYRPELNSIRNKWMVDHGDQVLGLWNGEREGGTWNTINYTQKVGKHLDLVQLAPQVWDMAKNTNEMMEAIRKSREAQRSESLNFDANRYAQAEKREENARARAQYLANLAGVNLQKSREAREKERQERIEEERAERMAILKAREDAQEQAALRELEKRKAAVQAELERAERRKKELEEQAEADRKAEAEHSQRLKPRRIIDIGD